MRTVTYIGAARNLRLGSGRVIPAGVPSEVSNADADLLHGRDDVDIRDDD